MALALTQNSGWGAGCPESTDFDVVHASGGATPSSHLMTHGFKRASVQLPVIETLPLKA